MTCHTRDSLKSYADHRFPNSSAGTRDLRFSLYVSLRGAHALLLLRAGRTQIPGHF